MRSWRHKGFEGPPKQELAAGSHTVERRSGLRTSFSAHAAGIFSVGYNIRSPERLCLRGRNKAAETRKGLLSAMFFEGGVTLDCTPTTGADFCALTFEEKMHRTFKVVSGDFIYI